VRAQMASGEPMPLPIVIAIMMDTLDGLHAAHEAKSESGEPLGVVHRDVSPQNVLVGNDGLSRVADFGIATAADRLHMTKPGEIKGKISYMSPEQIQGAKVDRRADVYAVGTMLFELATGQRAFAGDGFAEIAMKQLSHTPPRVSTFRSGVSAELEAIVDRALEKDAAARFPTARAMSEALGALGMRASAHEVGAWISARCPEFFTKRDALLAAVDSEAAAALETTGVEAPEAPTVTAHVNESPKTTRRTSRVLAIALLSFGGLAAVFAFRENLFRRSAPVTQTSATATLPVPDSASASAPPTTASIVVASASSTPAVVSAPPVTAVVSSVQRHHPAGSNTAAPVVDAATVRILPPCCEGGLRVRFKPACDDESNCPSH